MNKPIHRFLGNYQAPYLLMSIAVGILALTVGFHVLFAFWIALIVAYLQQDLIDSLAQNMHYSHAVIFVCCCTLSIIGISLWICVPFVYEQSLNFMHDFPSMIDKCSELLRVHSGVDVDLDAKLQEVFVSKSSDLFEQSASIMMHYLPSAIHFIIYMVTIPVLTFFFNLDRDLFQRNFRRLYPAKCPDLELIGREISNQLRYYMRGKIVHMIIIGAISFILFWYFRLNYALILSIPMGLSVFIPFVGTALATIPLALICYVQYGITWPALYVLGGHGLIHIWNENILVPMIFSKSNDMHPMTILSAVLIFGHLLGILGVFLAIPLAAILKILIFRWPLEKI